MTAEELAVGTIGGNRFTVESAALICAGGGGAAAIANWVVVGARYTETAEIALFEEFEAQPDRFRHRLPIAISHCATSRERATKRLFAHCFPSMRRFSAIKALSVG
ncbi:MAG: hypothetical protein HY288_19200 [Planctomycetia bacterium]|nr:hypothetical protein [Planctomycetia bacterium]